MKIVLLSLDVFRLVLWYDCNINYMINNHPMYFQYEMVNGEMGVSWEGEPIDDFMDLSDTNFLEVCEAFAGKIMMKNEKEHKQVSFTEEELINAIDISSGNKEVGEEEAKERGNADSAEGASKTTIDLDPEEIDLKTVSSGDKSIEISGLLKEETYLLSGT